jgi:hypothetical protein
MAGQDDIIQGIVLQGHPEVVAGFNAIGRAGTQAFEAIQAAGSLGGIGTALAGIAASASIVTVALYEWSKAAQETVFSMLLLSRELSTSIEEASTMAIALRRAGESGDNFANAVRRLAFRVENEWPQIQKSVRHAADLIIADQLRIAEAILHIHTAQTALAQAQNRFAEAEVTNQFRRKELQNQERDNVLSVAGAYLSLREAEYKLSLTRLEGGGRNTALEEEFEHERALLAVKEARQRVAEALLKQERDAAEFALKQRQAELAVEAAQEAIAAARLQQQLAALQLSQARIKAAEDEANSIANLKRYVDNLAEGVSNAGFKVQLSTQNILKGLIASVGPAIEGLEQFKGSLGEIGLAAPHLNEVLFKLADILHNTADGTLRTAIAVSAFGRGVSLTLVEALSKGAAWLRALQAELRALGFYISEADKKIAVDFRASLFRLSTDLQILSVQIAALFQPGFGRILDQFSQIVERNRQAILDWAAAVRDYLMPILESLVRVLLGIPDLAKDQWLLDYTEKIKAFGRAVQEEFQERLIPAFNAVTEAIGKVRDAFNSLFGTNLSGFDVVLLALVARWLGIFGLLRAGIAVVLGGLGAWIAGLLGAALAGVAAAIGTTALTIGSVIGGAIIAGILVGLNWDRIVGAVQSFLTQLQADWNDSIALWKFYLQDFADWFATTWVGKLLAAIAKIAAALASIKPTTPEGGELGGLAPAPGHARGGVLGGHSGTDTNLGMFSKGEYLVNASATAQHKPLLDMINFGGLKGYALGGLIGSLAAGLMMPARVPAYAGGGPIATGGGGRGGNTRGLTLVIADRSFDFHGTKDTVDALERYSVFSGMARLGPDPSWSR